jgi:hypothetical protein
LRYSLKGKTQLLEELRKEFQFEEIRRLSDKQI